MLFCFPPSEFRPPNSKMFSELHCKTNFSFLSGASHADELVTRAIELGYHSLAITDENTLAGVVKAFGAARKTDLKLIVGAEIVLDDAPSVVLWATDRKAYGRLSRLLTVGRQRAAKGECLLRFQDVAEYSEGLLAGVIPPVSCFAPRKNAHAPSPLSPEDSDLDAFSYGKRSAEFLGERGHDSSATLLLSLIHI